MSREVLVIVFGMFVAVSSFIGLPYAWLMVLLPVLGVMIIGVGIALRAKYEKLRAAPTRTNLPE